MLDTKLILIEGLPGSGKSTTAHHLAQHLTKCGIKNRWWYEEEKAHPVYVFNNSTSMQKVVEDLSNGLYHQVVQNALNKWQEFVDSLKSSKEVIIVDGCLFGYLTWSLFPVDVPNEEIYRYISEVERIISPLNPRLIYFYQDDTYDAMEKICKRRGGNTEELFIQSATQSAYGKRQELHGFEGMVEYWKDYRILTDNAFTELGIKKIGIENSSGKWSKYFNQILKFLDLPQPKTEKTFAVYLNNYVRTYCNNQNDEDTPCCTVQQEADDLILDGVPQVWAKSKLIPRAPNMFEIESLPFTVTFEKDGLGHVVTMKIEGPELIDGSVDRVFERTIVENV